jgi:hypothetical protein
MYIKMQIVLFCGVKNRWMLDFREKQAKECLLPLREKVPNGRMRGDQIQEKHI